MSVESPCIRVCTLDPTGRLCLGCYRTLEEIGAWAAMSDAERARVVQGLAARRSDYEAALFAAPAGTPERCERCGAGFVCGAKADAPCWCISYPPVRPTGTDARCLCPQCLAHAAAGQQLHG